MWISAGEPVITWPLAGNESTSDACAKASGLSVTARVASAMRSDDFMRPPDASLLDGSESSVFHVHAAHVRLLRLDRDVIRGIVGSMRRGGRRLARPFVR